MKSFLVEEKDSLSAIDTTMAADILGRFLCFFIMAVQSCQWYNYHHYRLCVTSTLIITDPYTAHWYSLPCSDQVAICSPASSLTQPEWPATTSQYCLPGGGNMLGQQGTDTIAISVICCTLDIKQGIRKLIGTGPMFIIHHTQWNCNICL